MDGASQETVESLQDGWEPTLVDIDVPEGETELVLDLFATEQPHPPDAPSPSVVPAPSAASRLHAVTAAATKTLTRVSLADLFASDMPLQRFEVIAIAQGVCQAMLQASQNTRPVAPPLWHVVLTSRGTVEIVSGIAADTSPVSLVIRILQTGLTDDRPFWLRSLLFLLKPVFHIATLPELASVLGCVERRGRAELIAGVVARFDPSRSGPVAPRPQFEEMKTTQPSLFNLGSRQELTAAAAVFVLAGTLVFDAWWLMEARALIRPKLAETPFAVPTRAPNPLLRRLGLVSSSPQSGDSAPYIFDASGRAHRKATGVQGRARAAGVPHETAAVSAALPARRTIALSAPTAAPAVREIQMNEPPESGHPVALAPAAWDAGATNDVVYDSNNTDVTPPIELSPYLASRNPHRNLSSGTAAFELVINEAGQVQSAQLLQPLQRWDDVMLLSAMKARRFRPATRNGLPVKYRTRIFVGASQDQ